MEWNFSDDRPIYAQLIEQIEQALVSGVFAPGEKLPGVREMAADAGVNPNTMQRALADMETRGLLYTQRTSGRFVTEDKNKITTLRTGLANSITTEYIRTMRALGCSSEELTAYIQNGIKEEL